MLMKESVVILLGRIHPQHIENMSLLYKVKVNKVNSDKHHKKLQILNKKLNYDSFLKIELSPI